jgi:hypothetical protein
MPEANTPSRIHPLTLLLVFAAAVLVVVCIVFFATSHPRRGLVVAVIAAGCLVGAWVSTRMVRRA